MFNAVSGEDEFHRVRMAYELDRTSFDNSDGFEEDDDLCDASSSDQDASSSNHWRGWKTDCGGPSSSRSWRDGGLLGSSSVSSSGVSADRDTRKNRHFENSTTHQVLPLVEIAAKEVACHIPFEVVEHFNQPVPVEVQLRIAFWSFPTSEEDIRLYSCLANSNDSEFTKGEDLWKQGCVKNLLQIGFHLSATVVQNPLSNSLKGSYNVAVTFDRRRVTSCNCNCQNSPSWCAHIVAVCLFRIYQPDQVCLRAPVSESLSRLGRDDLQKFAQYLINELPQQILPTAQKLLDDLLSKQNTYINTTSGAPDPTAGASIDEKTSWWLDESQLRDNLGKILRKHSQIQPMVVGDAMCLQTPISPVASEWANWLRPLRAREPEGVWNLLAIVRELFKRGDCNAVPLLKILTIEILTYQSIILWWFQTKVSHQTGSSGHGKINSSQSNALATQHGCSSICDEIVSLWRLASLNPSFSSAERDSFYQLLKDWHVNTLERVWKSKANNSTTNGNNNNNNNNNNKKTDFEIFAGFKPAMEACLLDWDDYLIPEGSGLTRSWLSSCPQTHSRKDQTKIFVSVGSESDQNRSNLDKNGSPSVRHTGRSLDMNQFFEKPSPPSNPEEVVASSSLSSSKPSPKNISSKDSVIKSSSEELKECEISCDTENVNNDINQPDVNGRPIDSYRSSFSSEGFCETSETDYNNESDEEMPLGQRRQRAKRAQETESSQDVIEDRDSIRKCAQMDNEGIGPQSSSKSSTLTDALTSLQAESKHTEEEKNEEKSEINESKNAEKTLELATYSTEPSDMIESNSPSSNLTPDFSSQNAKNFSHPKRSHPTEPTATCSTSQRKNVQRVCCVNLGDEQIKVIIKAISDPNEVLLARTEALHAHGLTKEACTLAVELAHNLLNHPPNLQIDLPNPPLRLKRARRVNPVCHQISLFVSSILSKATFLCQVLSEVEEYHDLAFKVGLFGLELARPPASTKSLEVKLFHQESEIVALLKKIPIGDEEMKILRERAKMLREGNHTRGESILPIALANFIFDALVYSSSLSQGFGSRSGSSIVPQPCTIRGRREPTDEKLAFEASIAALAMKANVCEADHPLLCEGTRKQRGEFIIELLIHYRDDNEALDKIMDKVCDKDMGLNHKESKPTLTPMAPDLAATNITATDQKPSETPKSPNDSEAKPSTDAKNHTEEPCSPNPSEVCSVSEEKAVESPANKNGTADKQRMSDGEGSGGATSPSWGENYKAWEARFRCTNFKTNKKHTVGMASIDSSAPETTSSDNSPTVVRRTVWMKPGSDSGSSGESSDSFASSSSGDKGVKNNLPCSALNPPSGSNINSPSSSTQQHTKNGPVAMNKEISQKITNCANRMSTCSVNERPHSSSKLNFILGSNSHHTSEGCQLSCCDPLPLFANQQRFNLTNNNILSMKPISNRHKNKKLYPSIPNQPSEASSCFMHELAKTLLDKAGGSSHSAVLFTQQPPNQNHEGPHRNLHMCALKIAFYALGLNNFVTQNWLSRTYSQNVAWIANQAVEIGAQAINFLIGKWEGYFTPTEASNLADRAFLHSSNDPVTKKAASRLALSCLPHAQALTLQEIQRAIALCKEHSSEMLEEACLAVEQVAKAGGELNPEVLFHVARKWYDLYETSLRGRNDTSTRDHRNRLPFVQASIGEFQVPSSSSSSPILHNSYFNHHHHHNPPNAHDLANIRGGHNSNIAAAVELNMRNNGHHHSPNNPNGSVLSFAQSSLQVIQAMPNYPMSTHPNQFIGIFSSLPTYHSTPFPFIPQFLAPGPEAAATYQYPTYMTGPPPQMSNNAANNLPMAIPTSSLPPYRNQIPPSLLTGPALMPNMMMTQSPQRFPLIPGGNPGPLVFPIVQAQPNSHLVSQPPALCLSNKTQAQPHQQHNQKQLDYLYSAYRVAVLAMEALRRKNHDEGPKNKFARNPPYEEDIKWMVALTKELGSPYFQYFCKCCELSITSPFVLLYIVKEASSYYSHSHNSQSHQIRSSILSSLVTKCQHMFTAAIVSKVNNGPSPKNEAEVSQEIHFLIQGARQVMDHQHLNEMVTKLHSLRNAKKDILAHIDNCLQSANAV